LAGQERDATIARFFWDCVVNTRSFAPGGVDLRERFCAPGAEAPHLAWNSCESCCVYNMLKLTRHLFGWRPDAAYMDYYERALYNHILGSQDPDSGGFTYFYSLRPGHFKIYSSPFDSMWCCVGTGIENHSKYADTIYFYNDSRLWVNLFIPAELDWQQKNVGIRQETKFPEEDTTTITISTKQPQAFTVKVRVPYWVKQDVEVTINGETQAVEAEPQSYLTLSRTWNDGDKIQVKLPMGLRLYHARDDKTLAVVMYGPLVLAGELGREGMPDNLCCSGNTSHAGNLAPPVPVLVVDSEEPSTWIKRVEGEPLKFRTSGVGKPKDVSLIPLANLHHQRYTVYLKRSTTKVSKCIGIPAWEVAGNGFPSTCFSTRTTRDENGIIPAARCCQRVQTFGSRSSSWNAARRAGGGFAFLAAAACLFYCVMNKAKLPASPFNTDNWQGGTDE
jgi:DUF1680 family protein